jgi:hypothetical protein
VSEGNVGTGVDATVVATAQGYQTGVASASIEDTLLISSEGVTGPGFLEIITQRLVPPTGLDGSADSGFILGQTTVTNQNSNYIEFFDPVTLGVPTEVQIYADATSSCFVPYFVCSLDFAQGTSTVEFQLYQGSLPDITAVDTLIVSSPEPSTFALYGLGIALAALLLRCRRSMRLAA